ncbi:hypothetical protein JTE90_018458 [Oedothorax gibbosus]|uniref:BTB domain-containing protein n=1 Tax=Oedothorax gibbosus TaxID=931172 RepID=A0AAV6V0U9_9ARAC|nr:hypothetical protein JTE90_018458 [Oedothorax gibbosus]
MGNTVAHSFLRSSLPSKRKSQAINSESEDGESEDEMFSPKRRKIMSTSKYIYKTLFEEGQGSDVQIEALNRTWNLHRLYLSQSPYFNSMFNGLWVETTQKEIRMGIEDENITSEALHKVFGSLYQDEIQIQPSEAVSILASATLLQLDDIIQQSIEVMKDSINIDTVLSFHEAAELYGLNQIKCITMDWLHKNTVLRLSASPAHLQQVSCTLMAELISSPNLVVVQTEFSLYLLLKQWVFLKENISFRNYEACTVAADQYFKSNAGTLGNVPYLMTNTGSPYQSAFRALRLKHLIIHHIDMELIEADCIIPVDWFMPIFKVQWYQMLRVDQGVDKGPSHVSEEDFKRDCVRCGRILHTDTQHSWRWTGYNFGFDIVLCYARGCFKLKRFQKAESESRVFHSPSEMIPLRSKKRNLMYQICVYSLDKNGRIISKGETPIRTVSLNENEQVPVLNFHGDMKFPLLMSANFLLTTPLQTTDEIMPTISQNKQLAF